METKESLGYLKGLIDGLDIEENSKEAKIYKAIIGVLDELVEDVDAMTEGLMDLGDDLDAVDEDLAELEEYVYDECDDDCCCDDDYDDEPVEFEVECPSCGAQMTVDEDTVMEGKFECPECGEVLEFEFDDDCDCDDEDCDCED